MSFDEGQYTDEESYWGDHPDNPINKEQNIMENRFKFRAWHHGGGDPRTKGQMIYTEGWKLGSFFKQVENEPLAVELMQSTGLTDKNGKLIYEGDVVLMNEERMHVTWDKTFAKFNLKRIIAQHENQDHFHLSKHFEIIGNIYKNPELLTQNDQKQHTPK